MSAATGLTDDHPVKGGPALYAHFRQQRVVPNDLVTAGGGAQRRQRARARPAMRKVVVTLIATVAMLLAAPVAQSAVRFNESIPISLDVFVPCAANGAGELVALNGNLHVLLTFTINNNNVSGISHDQPQGLTGTGLTTGDKYQGTGVTESHFKVPFNASANTFTFVNNFRIIGQGPGNNLLIHEDFHVTINANGMITASFDHVSAQCM
jgi:hypothetical protein